MLFAVFDTETTGLPFHMDAELSSQPRLIEFAGIITDGVEILDSLEFICNPGIVIEPIITQITGLTNDDLKDKPPFAEFFEQTARYFSQAYGVIAHNEAFDRAMLHYDLLRIGKTLADVNWPALEICTVEQSFHQFGRRMKLQELYELYCGPYVQKHRALDDVKLLHEVARNIGVYEALKEVA